MTPKIVREVLGIGRLLYLNDGVRRAHPKDMDPPQFSAAWLMCWSPRESPLTLQSFGKLTGNCGAKTTLSSNSAQLSEEQVLLNFLWLGGYDLPLRQYLLCRSVSALLCIFHIEWHKDSCTKSFPEAIFIRTNCLKKIHLLNNRGMVE